MGYGGLVHMDKARWREVWLHAVPVWADGSMGGFEQGRWWATPAGQALDTLVRS